MSAVIPKPKMRGLHHASVKKSLTGAIIASCTACVLWKIFVCDRRKKAIADFYKTYDPVASLKIMTDAGLMQSCPK